MCVFLPFFSTFWLLSFEWNTYPPPQKKNHAIFLAGTKPCSGRDDQETRWGSELSDCESLSFMDGSSDVGCFRNPFSKNVTKQSYGKIEQHLTQTYACQSLVVSKTFKQECSDCAIEENRFVQPTLKYIYIDMYMYIYIYINIPKIHYHYTVN